MSGKLVDITKKKRVPTMLKDDVILADIFSRIPSNKIEEKDVVVLERWYKMGMTDSQACAFAWVSVSTWRKFLDVNPEIQEWVKWLQESAIAKATSVIYKSLDSEDEKIALDTAKYLKNSLDERFQKTKETWGTTINIDKFLQMNQDKSVSEAWNNLVNMLRNS